MTMSPNAPTTIDFSTAGQTWKAVASRIAAALRAERARRQALSAYRRMLQRDDDHLLRDVGITRDDIRAAMRALDGRS